jgi:hypothetical protein
MHGWMCVRMSAGAALLAASVVAAQGAPLAVVNVGAPAINCVFNTSCTVTVSDSIGNIPLPGISGTARLQSRTYVGAPPAPGAGKHVYEYRVDLTQAVGILNIPCVTALTINFGPVSKLQYNGSGPLDDVFVVTSGGLGTVGIGSANKFGNIVTFVFSSPICAGGHPGAGATSYFFGLASTTPPMAISAMVRPSGGPALAVPARAPSH